MKDYETQGNTSLSQKPQAMVVENNSAPWRIFRFLWKLYIFGRRMVFVVWKLNILIKWPHKPRCIANLKLFQLYGLECRATSIAKICTLWSENGQSGHTAHTEYVSMTEGLYTNGKCTHPPTPPPPFTHRPSLLTACNDDKDKVGTSML